MPTEVRMPKLGESVVEGTISRWLKRPGERVELYEALLEVQTDKVDTEVPAPGAGVVREIAVPEGTTVKVGTLLAVLDDGEPSPSDDADSPTAETAVVQETPPVATASPQAKFVSPVVARMAQEHGLDLSRITGTGAGGRVSKKDVERFLAETTRPAAADPARPQPAHEAAAAPPRREEILLDERPDAEQATTEPPRHHAEDAELIRISPMRRAIAAHMERSVRTAPHVTTVFEADLGRVLAHRERSRAEFERQGARLTLTPYFLQAIVAGIRATPIINSTWTDEGILCHRRAHLGVAVALPEGLVVPVIRDAGERSLLGLARAVEDLAQRARSQRLQPGETQGGTFTLTNHGTGGSLLATPIINQPQSAILGVGAAQKRPVVLSLDGQDSIAIRPMCYLSLTFDHRVFDGATADAFLAAVRRFLESYAD
jgi:2-oxoisovalerate dehydrogenase E2 component (dihydrolipoyl transacylase)